MSAPRIPSIGSQPHSPVRVERCGAELRIDRNSAAKTISYRHAIRVFNASGKNVKRIDFAVFGLDDGARPVVAMTVTTRWKKPFKNRTSSYGTYAESSSIPLYYRITPWDQVHHLQCAVTRVYYTAAGQWKDLDVIRLAADASPDVCVYDVPDGAVAESCDEPSRLTSQDMVTASRLQTAAQAAAKTATAAKTKSARRSAVRALQSSPPSNAPAHKDVLAPSGKTLSLAVVMARASSDIDVTEVGDFDTYDGAFIVFGADQIHRIVCGPRGAATDIVFIAADGTISGVATITPGAAESQSSHINGFGSYAIALQAGRAMREGFLAGVRLSGFP
jgi:hypothetical protein